jgi:hypothetical protein
LVLRAIANPTADKMKRQRAALEGDEPRNDNARAKRYVTDTRSIPQSRMASPSTSGPSRRGSSPTSFYGHPPSSA